MSTLIDAIIKKSNNDKITSITLCSDRYSYHRAKWFHKTIYGTIIWPGSTYWIYNHVELGSISGANLMFITTSFYFTDQEHVLSKLEAGID